MKEIKERMDYIRQNMTTSIRCKTCDSIVLKEPKIEGYPYYCPKCGKLLFEIDTLESYRKATTEDVLDVVEHMLDVKQK